MFDKAHGNDLIGRNPSPDSFECPRTVNFIRKANYIAVDHNILKMMILMFFWVLAAFSAGILYKISLCFKQNC